MSNQIEPEELFHPSGIGDRVWHYAVLPALRLFADDTLTFYARLRYVVSGTIVIALCFLVGATFLSPASKLLNAAGIAFDLAGAMRLFLLERIQASLDPFTDESKYPYGPPSVAMRELIMPEAGPYTSGTPHMHDFYYRYRGVFFFIIGFSLQLVANFL